MLTTQDRKQQAFEITGVAPTMAVNVQLGLLREEGILVDLNITGTGMFQKTPIWAELGIPEFTGDRRVTQFTKGNKFLYPEEKVRALKSFQSRLSQNLERYTYDVTGFRPFRWLPYTAYQAWREKHDQIITEAHAFIDTELIACHDECLSFIAQAYREIAEAAWLSATTGETDSGRRMQKYDSIEVYDKKNHEYLNLDHVDFVDFIIRLAVSQVPTVEDIQNKLVFGYTTALVYGEADVASDEAAAANIRAQVSFEREKADLENQLLTEQVRKQAWDNQVEQTERETQIEAMRQAEYDHHRQQLQETVSPFVEVYRAAMSQFIDHAKDMLESIQKNKHVRGKVAERGRGLLDLYNLMVIPGMGDDRMMSYLSDLRSMLGPVDDGVRDPEKIAAKLHEIVALEAEVSRDLSAMPTAASFIEV